MILKSKGFRQHVQTRLAVQSLSLQQVLQKMMLMKKKRFLRTMLFKMRLPILSMSLLQVFLRTKRFKTRLPI